MNADGRAKCDEGRVPGAALLGAVASRFGSDWIGRMVEAIQLAACTDVSSASLPFQPVQGVLWHWAEGLQGPGRRVFGEVFADPVLAGVHAGGHVNQEALPFRLADLRNPLGPWLQRRRGQWVGPLSHAS